MVPDLKKIPALILVILTLFLYACSEQRIYTRPSLNNPLGTGRVIKEFPKQAGTEMIRSSLHITDKEVDAMNLRKKRELTNLPEIDRGKYYFISPEEIVARQKEKYSSGKFLKYMRIFKEKEGLYPRIDRGVAIGFARKSLKEIRPDDILDLMAEYITGFHNGIILENRTGYYRAEPDIRLVIAKSLSPSDIYRELNRAIQIGRMCEDIYKTSLKLRKKLVSVRVLTQVMRDHPEFRSGLMNDIKERSSLTPMEIIYIKEYIEKLRENFSELMLRQKKIIRALEGCNNCIDRETLDFILDMLRINPSSF